MHVKTKKELLDSINAYESKGQFKNGEVAMVQDLESVAQQKGGLSHLTNQQLGELNAIIKTLAMAGDQKDDVTTRAQRLVQSAPTGLDNALAYYPGSKTAKKDPFQI